MLIHNGMMQPKQMFYFAMSNWHIKSFRELAERLNMPHTTLMHTVNKNELGSKTVELLDLLGYDVEIKLVPKPEFAELQRQEAEMLAGIELGDADKERKFYDALHNDPILKANPGDFSRENKTLQDIQYPSFDERKNLFKARKEDDASERRKSDTEERSVWWADGE